jgi:hypothetical protein
MSNDNFKKTLSFKELELVKQKIDALDFSLMKERFLSDYSYEQVQQMEKEYKGFLFLQAAYPIQILVPTEKIDIMWHAHILDTMRYANDCENIYGYFLHHYPYLSMRGENDKANWINAFKKTKSLFSDIGINLESNSAMCGDSDDWGKVPAMCGDGDDWGKIQQSA